MKEGSERKNGRWKNLKRALLIGSLAAEPASTSEEPLESPSVIIHVPAEEPGVLTKEGQKIFEKELDTRADEIRNAREEAEHIRKQVEELDKNN